MLKVAGVGAILGFLGAVGIYFEPEEPYPGYITLAGTLSGVTIAMLITTVVTRNSSLGRCLGWGLALSQRNTGNIYEGRLRLSCLP